MQSLLLTPMVLLGVLGIVLFLFGAWVARGIARVVRGRVDPVGLGRVLRVAGLAMIVAAVAVRPENPWTAAVGTDTEPSASR